MQIGVRPGTFLINVFDHEWINLNIALILIIVIHTNCITIDTNAECKRLEDRTWLIRISDIFINKYLRTNTIFEHIFLISRESSFIGLGLNELLSRKIIEGNINKR